MDHFKMESKLPTEYSGTLESSSAVAAGAAAAVPPPSSSSSASLNFSFSGKERVVAKTQDPSVITSTGGGDQVYSGDDKDEDLDWVLTNYDRTNSEPQSLDEELRRLQTLKSYLILDAERETQFERLTALAGRILNVPIALVSLVDLGRQWFMSNRGLGDVRETPRSQAFCSHAILSKDDILIIKDAKLDPRFVNNPLVTGPPFIRFYAGAPLQSPDGYKLGTFCVIDTKPRLEGLDLESKQNLRELAGLAVEVLVARRAGHERNRDQNPQLIACTAHDLLTPLSGIELSLHLLKDDKDFQAKLLQSQKEGIQKKIETCSDVIQDICKSVQSKFSVAKSSFEESLSKPNLERFEADSLVDRLYTVIDSLKKDVPVKIIVDKAVPKTIISDPSKIFRCAMNFLAVACERTKKGMISLTVQVRQPVDGETRDSDSKVGLLSITCEDTAPAVGLEMYEHLFKPVDSSKKLFPELGVADDSKPTATKEICPELCLLSVASEMNVIGGEYGYRPRSETDSGCAKFDEETGHVSGSVFWFCLPCIEVTRNTEGSLLRVGDEKIGARKLVTSNEASKFQLAVSGVMGGTEMMATATNGSTVERTKRALVIEDSTVVRKMLTKILGKLGLEVSQAENGMEGLEKLKSTIYDLTLCDFLMPIMDGLDCVKQYRDWESYHRPWFSQRIVGISAHASDADVSKGLNVGMNDYAPKPVTFKILSELIKCDEQIEVSNKLNAIASRESFMRSAEDNVGNTPNKRTKPCPSINARPCACLVIAGNSENEHVKLMQDVIKKAGWQTTTASNDNEAMAWLKMRTWDLVLIDEAFSALICDFREWELKKRESRQQQMTMMCETANEQMVADVKPPPGLDAVTGKPICLNALSKLLHKTHFLLNNEASSSSIKQPPLSN